MSSEIGLSAEEARADSALVRWSAALPNVEALGCLYMGLVALMIAPVLIWPIPRAADIVNHWARLTVLNMPAADPLNAFYSVRFAIIPNLGIDLLYLAVSPVLSAESVARLAWALAIALPAWGAWRLHRALFATPQLAMLLIPPISYNLVVTVGLVNYGLGMGVALLALAWAIRCDSESPWCRLVVLNLASVVLLFCHALALLAFCIAFGLHEITPTPLRAWRLALARGAISPLYAALGLILLAFAEHAPGGFELAGDKSFVFDAPFFAMTDYDTLIRLAALVALAAAAASRRLSVAPPMRATLVVFAGLIVVMPSAWGAGNLLDARLAVFWAYLAIPALGWTGTGRASGLAVAALVALSLARFVSVLPAWSLYEREAAAMREVFATIPTGARVLVVKPPSEVCHDRDMPMLNNVTALAVIDRRAMVNTLFADPGMQPIRVRDVALAAAPKLAMSSRWLQPEDRPPLGALLDRPWAEPFLHWRDHFDTVVSLHGVCFGRIDAPGLERVGASSVADVYRTH